MILKRLDQSPGRTARGVRKGEPKGRRRATLLPTVVTLEERVLLSAISDAAYTLLLARSAMNGQAFFVYQNADSALNHGFPSGKFGRINAIHVDTAGVNDSASPTGVTTSPDALDRARGTVMQIVFDPLGPGQFTGLNIEEPENWSVRRLQPGVQLRGYDLRGATELDFEARSPTPGGISVQFSVGGHVTPYMTIPQSSDFRTYRITLSGLGLAASDLSNVSLLFGVATNDVHAPAGGTLLIDNIQYVATPSARAAQPSLPLANQTFGVVPQSTDPFPMDQVLRNVATTYEAALAVMSLLVQPAGGAPIPAADLAAARGICDAFVYALGHENSGDPLPTSNVNGETGIGLHNAYSAGDLALYNDQDATQNQLGKQGQVRLAGFSVVKGSTPSFYLILDGASGGNNAFAIMALTRGYLQFGDTRYLDAAETVGRWIAGNLADTSGTGYGGYYVGYPDAGKAKVLQTGKSVENNADIAAAFVMLSQIEAARGGASASALWLQRAYAAGDFVMAMFDPAAGRFNAGTVPVGSAPGPGIVPDGPRKGDDVINTADFLDAETFTTLALAGLPRYHDQIDWRRPIDHVIATFAKSATATSGGQARTYQGFGLVAAPNPAPGIPNPVDGVAWEFTAQAGDAMRFVDRLYGETRFESRADATLAQVRQAQQYAPYADGAGLVAATLDGEVEGRGYSPARQVLSTPFQTIPERVGLAASSWAILADNNANVFTTGSNTFVVTNVADSGPGSLRQAILDANAHPNSTRGSDTIVFAIPGAGVHTITPASPLPPITDPAVIDGTTQPGARANTLADGDNAVLLVALDGSKAGPSADGLVILASHSVVRGLAIGSFTRSGINVSTNGVVIAGNFIGTDPTGTIARPDGASGVEFDKATGGTVGGTTPADRNVISANTLRGVEFNDVSTGNVVLGNFIGTTADGTKPLGNGQEGVVTYFANNIIGGAAPGARNVISANGTGVSAPSGSATGTQVIGNDIGTDVTGTKRLGNTGLGVFLNGPDGFTITGNLISANGSSGIQISNSLGSGGLIARNIIGADTTGTQPLGNLGAGIRTVYASNLTIGGTTPGSGNLIVANSAAGIFLDGSGSVGNVIQGNAIGVDRAGHKAMGNGNLYGPYGNPEPGVRLANVKGTLVGGTTPGAANLIAANYGAGIEIGGSPRQGGSNGNAVIGNIIGTSADGSSGFGNKAGGIWLYYATGNTIGGTAAGAGNVIASNTGPGIAVDVGGAAAIEGNAIVNNTAIGIDLGFDGVTLNDSKGHSGPNNYQNFPVITRAEFYQGQSTIGGTLDSLKSTSFRVEFFASAAADPSGYGEGQILLGAVTVTTDANGHAAFTAKFATPSTLGQSVAATAIDPAGNTSEFSKVYVVKGLVSVAAGSSVAPSAYGQPVNFTAAVTPPGGRPVPTGTVQFVVDGSNFGAPVPLARGAAVSSVVTTLGAGPHTVLAVYSGDGNYAGNTSGGFTQVVAKAHLTVTANSLSKVYGAAVPALTYTVSGFVNGDTAAVVRGSPSLGTTAVKTSPAGKYPIIVTAGTLSASNYDFILVNGTLTVTGAKAATFGIAVAQAPDSEASPSPSDRMIPRWWRKGRRLSRSLQSATTESRRKGDAV